MAWIQSWAAPPTASFIGQPTTFGRPPLVITFNAASSSDPEGGPLVYDWDFGDGTTLPNGGPTPSHTYPVSGTYIPRLTVTDQELLSHETAITVLCFSSVTLQVGSVSAVAGEDVFVDVVYSSSAEVGSRGLSFTVSETATIDFVDAFTSVLNWSLSANPANGSVSMNSVGGFDLPDGVAATLRIRVAAGASPGSYALTLSTAIPTLSSGLIQLPARIIPGTLTVLPGAPAPVLTSSAIAQGVVNAAFSYQSTANNSPTGYAAEGLPPGLEISTTTGLISGTPNTVGTFRVNLTATNGAGTNTLPLKLIIAPQAAPVLAVGTVAGPDGTYMKIPITLTPGSTPVTGIQFNVSHTTSQFVTVVTTGPACPQGTTVAKLPGQTTAALLGNKIMGHGVIAYVELWTYAGIPAGVYPVSFSAATFRDVNNDLVAGSFTSGSLTVQASAMAAPTLTSASSASGSEDTPFVYQILATNNPASYSATGLPAGLTIDAASGYISGAPSAQGTYNVTIGAANVNGEGTAPLTLTIGAAPPALPVVTSAGSATAFVGSAFAYQVTASNSPLSYSATGLPVGLGINPATGLVSGIPAGAGVTVATVTATNAFGSGNKQVTITAVVPVAPVITSSDTAAGYVGAPFSYQITAANTPVTFNATGLPAGLSIDVNTGLISGTPAAAGNSNVTLSATNPGGTGNLVLALGVTVLPKPVITSASDVTWTVGTPVNYQITATNGATSFNAAALPPGVSVSTTTGLISGTPTASGFAIVSLSATNAVATGEGIIHVIINPFFSGPRIINYIGSPEDITFVEGNSVIRLPWQIATDSPATSYSATNLPPGLTLDTVSGAISGLPLIPGFYDTTLVATNGSDSFTGTVHYLVLPAAGDSPPLARFFASTGTSHLNFNFDASPSRERDDAALVSPIYEWTFGDGTTGTGMTTSHTYVDEGTYTVVLTLTNDLGLRDKQWFRLIVRFVSPATMSVNHVSGNPGDDVDLVFTHTPSPEQGTQSLIYEFALPPEISTVSLTPGASLVSAGWGVSLATTTRQTYFLFTFGQTPNIVGEWTVATLRVHIPVTASSAVIPVDISNPSFNGVGGGGLLYIPVTRNSGSITVLLSTPVITSTGAAQVLVNAPFSYQITASQFPTSYNATGRPPGVNINTTTGLLSGTPTSTGTYNVSLAATNSVGTGTKTLVLSVVTILPPSITSAGTAQATVGTPFTYQITATNSPTIYSLTGTLPSGLSFTAATGRISGTPTAAGIFPVTIGATNAGGTGTRVLTLTVATVPPPAITSALAAQGTVNVPFSYQITATNNPTNYDAFGLPAGLTVDTAAGLISGTPTSSGTFIVTLEAANAGGSGFADVSLTIGLSAVVRAYPNPWRADRNAGPVLFSNLSAGARIRIFSENGRAVKSFTAASSSSGWDLTDDGGGAVSSGLYFFLITDDAGATHKGKVFIAR